MYPICNHNPRPLHQQHGLNNLHICTHQPWPPYPMDMCFTSKNITVGPSFYHKIHIASLQSPWAQFWAIAICSLKKIKIPRSNRQIPRPPPPASPSTQQATPKHTIIYSKSIMVKSLKALYEGNQQAQALRVCLRYKSTLWKLSQTPLQRLYKTMEESVSNPLSE